MHINPKCKTHPKLDAWIYGSLASITVSQRRHTLLLIFSSFIHGNPSSLYPICLLSCLLHSSLLLQSFSVRLGGNIHGHPSIRGYWSLTGATVGKQEYQVGWGRNFGFTGEAKKTKKKTTISVRLKIKLHKGNTLVFLKWSIFIV